MDVLVREMSDANTDGKSCSPGIPTLMLSEQNDLLATGQERPIPGESTK
jgi:hypothetical protein